MSKKGNCWLCGKLRDLTEEHIPPRKAFNDAPLLLESIDRISRTVGRRVTTLSEYENGWCITSLCGECNSKCGGQYGSHYVDFVRTVAERVEKASDGDRIHVPGVRRPLSILKTIMQIFVSANGPKFVEANPWVQKFVHNSRWQEWPHDAELYIFAVNSRGGRKSGVASVYDANTRCVRVGAEFVFWPLGMALFFGRPLSSDAATPVHQWAKNYPYGYTGTVDLSLRVNPVVGDQPFDYRDARTISRQSAEESEPLETSPDVMEELKNSMTRYGGHDSNDSLGFVAKKRPRILSGARRSGRSTKRKKSRSLD